MFLLVIIEWRKKMQNFFLQKIILKGILFEGKFSTIIL